ncbi:hypothetical protein FHU09_0980 [Serratia fonticola]|nr:hypothetical protein FHU09_0980 [Serratia fonticola]
MERNWTDRIGKTIQLLTLCIVCINPLFYGDESKTLTSDTPIATSIFTININK